MLIVHDFGNSINPAIDTGQMEGGVMQGIGWMTMEEVLFSQRGQDAYRQPLDIQGARYILCPGSTRSARHLETSGPEPAIFKSKAVGEPPFMYGIGAFFALQNAVRAFNPQWKPDYDAPLTPEKILMRLYGTNHAEVPPCSAEPAAETHSQ
ncbi:MAG: molybdopterin-dependent oxidoreductase [Marinilabiliales bacterium]|nr:molybdopterin-dependent oxidoreductase [Marinilabiliales bacterium]